ncbi:hypothetical protein CRG98_016071 [Punica granatum]|uniref:TIR domain-containing protein n=1 Tax=Punica granatum TaxID=22663 RepID=A0A2I0K5Y9_PUNGR|nr:hypothetical protein CRG98_016071 [Punica granatum]
MEARCLWVLFSQGMDVRRLPELPRSSRISVVVLSRNYANSSWCLQELSEIMECRNKSLVQMVLPVFYNVDPSDVRKQTGCFGEAFTKHEEDRDKETVARWRAALTEVGNIVRIVTFALIVFIIFSTEAKIVKEIALRICNELNNTYLDVAKHPVGLRSRMIDVNDDLNDPSDDVRFIVIWGMGVLGSHLLERSVEHWKSVHHQLGRNPHRDIQQKLEISYHALGSEDEKKLFLDIACFFVGGDKNLVVKVLEVGDLCVGLGLDVLCRRSLVKITSNNKLEMHDMIRDMGRAIVRRESPHNPGKRSRLFYQNDILATVRNHSGTEQVEGLVSNDYLELAEKVDAKAFERMRQLRLLKLNDLHVDGDYGLISKELKWLSWHGFPLDFLPEELCMRNLVVLDMQYSKLRSTWKTNSKKMPCLKVLNLSYSHFLTMTPDFSGLLKLEELIMEDCTELKEIDRSIGCLEELLLVNLKDCKKLKSIPDSICKVRSLQILNIQGCSSLMRLPDDFGNLESLTELLADGALTMQYPLSFTNLKNLAKLSLCGYNRWRSSSFFALEVPKENNWLIASLCGLRSLTELQLINCNISDDANLECIGSLKNLTRFNLWGSHLRCLPGSISSLSNLDFLEICHCPKLESLPDLSQKTFLSVFDCQSLRRISLPNSQVRTIMALVGCPGLTEISHSGVLNPIFLLSFNGCNEQLSVKLNELILKFWPGGVLSVSGSNIPEWFEYQSTGDSISFQLPACHSCKLNEIYVAYVIRNVLDEEGTFGYSRLFNLTRGKCIHSSVGLIHPGTKNSNIFSMAPEEIMEVYEGIKVRLDVEPHPHLITTAIGIHLEVEECPSCSGIYIDDVEAGSSDGDSHDEYPQETENEPTTEITAGEQWLLRYCPLKQVRVSMGAARRPGSEETWTKRATSQKESAGT